MTESTVETAPPAAVPRRVFAGVFLASFAALLLELCLTRLFSVVLFYHFAFLAISVALLGLGSGGLLAFLTRERWSHIALERRAALACWAAVAGSLIALRVVLHSPISLDISAANFGRLSAIYLSAALPFAGVGFCISSVIASFAHDVHRIYFADLAGAGAACSVLVPLMDGMGGPSAVLVCAVLLGCAALVFAWTAPPTRASAAGCALGAACVAVLLLGAVWNRHGRHFDVTYAKGSRRPTVEFKRWNSLSRIEVFGTDHKDIMIDADADTALVGVSLEQAQRDPALAARFMRYTPALPYVVRPGGRVLVIGPGGGSDVMRALLGGSRNVAAVEINPIIVRDIMQGRYRDWSHGLYLRPEVQAVVAEGRSYIRQSRVQYDVIEATMVDTWASTAAGALALSENNLYTVEAFREYLRHLTPAGVLAITRWEFAQPREALRVTAVAMQALREEYAIADASPCVAAASDGALSSFGVTVTTLIKRRPFTPEEGSRLVAYAAAHPPMRLLYAPGATGDSVWRALLASRDARRFSAHYPYNIAPPTDDRPFFFYTLKTSAALMSALFPQASEQRAMDWKNNLALFLLVSLLLITGLAVGVFLLLPLYLGGGASRLRGERALRRLPYFIALGLGYILIEIAFIQRFVLFLGHPTYALTVVLIVMLGSSALGSYWAGARQPVADAGFDSGARALRGIIAVATLYAFVVSALLSRWVGAPLALKLVISACLIAPLALLMGVPFPAGIRRLRDSGGHTVEWAWALNAAATVLGSVLAIFVVIHLGVRGALIAGTLAYVLALVTAPALAPGPAHVLPAADAFARPAGTTP